MLLSRFLSGGSELVGLAGDNLQFVDYQLGYQLLQGLRAFSFSHQYWQGKENEKVNSWIYISAELVVHSQNLNTGSRKDV